jgi:hypothetical protein
MSKFVFLFALRDYKPGKQLELINVLASTDVLKVIVPSEIVGHKIMIVNKIIVSFTNISYAFAKASSDIGKNGSNL